MNPINTETTPSPSSSARRERLGEETPASVAAAADPQPAPTASLGFSRTTRALLSDARVRGVAIQGAALCVFCAVVFGAMATAWVRMRAQGMTYGFGILARSTGWNVSSVLLQQAPSDPYWWVLVVAVANTVLVAVLSIVLATLFGFAVGILRHAGNPLLSLVLTVFVETFRNIPLLLQLIFWYSAFSNLPVARQALALAPGVYLSNQGLFVPSITLWGSGLLAALAIACAFGLCVFGIVRLFRFSQRVATTRAKIGATLAGFALMTLLAFAVASIVDVSAPQKQRFSFEGGLALPIELFTLVFAIVVFSSAYISEVVRGGLQSVAKGQWEACHAVGLKLWQAYAYVVIPIAVRTILPSLGNQYVFVVKSTALGIAIGFSDIFSVSVVSITQSGQTIEFLLIMMAVYLVMNYSLSWGVNYAHRRLNLTRRR